MRQGRGNKFLFDFLKTSSQHVTKKHFLPLKRLVETQISDMRSLLLSAALLCAVLRGSNVKAEDTDNPMTGNVVDVAFSMPQTFSTLIFLLTRAGLVDVLRDPTLDSTVFSPTNDAFIALDALNLPSANTRVLSADDDWLPHLQDFLTYHVLGGSEVFAEDITDGLTVTMLNGEESSFSLADGVAINTATVVAADVTANNGKYL
jgi:uncharacterized surface protein with fasciclin (FAS1) repeats